MALFLDHTGVSTASRVVSGHGLQQAQKKVFFCEPQVDKFGRSDIG